ncbi:MAG: TRAP transporter large permease subunit [Alphaproteobacteria bacterium]|nr:TRAP transporter large permease subunit [Alphaproteobacteria bacterium]
MELFLVMGVLPVILLILGFPIFVILMVSSVITILFIMDLPITMVQIELFGSVDNYKLIAVPFFIFAGAIMAQGGISRRLVDWVVSLLGAVRGSLALTTVGACTIFGAISGSSPATVAAIGGMLFPSLREKGYPEKFASGLLASSGAIAGIIPPSIAMILYGAAAEESVRHLFIAGVLPGLFIAFVMGLYIYFYARKRDIQEGEKFTVKRVGRTTKAGAWALGTPLIILGGIYAGIFSPTEAAGVACLYAVIVAMWVYRDMTPTGLWKVTIESVYLTAQVLIIVGAATLFSRLLTIAGVPQSMVEWIQGLGLESWMVLLIINVFLLLVGCVLDPASAILVLAPILKPVILAAGIDPIHFGIIMTVNVSIGMFTPPFGLNIFVTQALFRVPLSSLYPGLVPFIIINLIALGVISYWPDLSLVLVRLLG